MLEMWNVFFSLHCNEKMQIVQYSLLLKSRYCYVNATCSIFRFYWLEVVIRFIDRYTVTSIIITIISSSYIKNIGILKQLYIQLENVHSADINWYYQSM
jgi:hypothetical protein